MHLTLNISYINRDKNLIIYLPSIINLNLNNEKNKEKIGINPNDKLLLSRLAVINKLNLGKLK